MKLNQNLNHTAAHVLAASVLKLYPNTKIAIGPVTKEGFYYDFDFEKNISEDELLKIEKQMKKIISSGAKIEKVKKIYLNNPYKKELIKEFKSKGKKITYYALIDPATKKSIFTDLCKGGHVNSVNEIKHFKLFSLTGAFWKGNSKNKQLSRIYGTAWKTKEELKNFLDLLQERIESDHKKIGKKMKIFTFYQKTGQGFPLWLENGMIIKNEIQKYIRKTEYQYGFNEVETPAFGSKELYIKSGHWDHYKNYMFPQLKIDNETLIMRPMTCPHHILIYASSRKSYRDLPIRMSEQSRLYRYEASGALSGLERVRSMMLTEGHIFARNDQIKKEFLNSYKLIMKVLKKFEIEIDYVSLSLRDKNNKKKYFDDDHIWDEAENKLREVLNELKINYKEERGEAAFYGPKIDIQVKTSLQREITLSTLQLDFLLPKRFDLTYIDKNEKKQNIIMIHRGLIGTYERFVAILLEQTKGNLPFWLAPKQAIIIPISLNKHLNYAKEIEKILIKKNMRVKIDSRDERLSKKIREAQINKTKFQIVIGDNEVKNNKINIRAFGSQDYKMISIEEFIKMEK